MNKLLRANFTRLWKNKVFWGCMIYMFVNALSAVIAQYKSMKEFGGEYALSVLEPLGQTVAAAVVSAIFIGLYIGTEHSNGTLRNKLIIGHSRASIYFANLAVCTAASLMLHAVYFLTVLVSGLTFLGGFSGQMADLAGLFAISIIIVIAYAAMFLPISTLITSKASGSTAVIVISFVLIVFAMVISQVLNEPEVNEAYTIIDASGSEITEPETKNPYYISGVQRDIYEALYDILPTCQAVRVQFDDMPEDAAVIPLWSAAVIAVTTAAGTIAFRRKDLK